ncbi:MFS transporter [Corynebacterium sp. MSK006]|uniref:MFS transporter n=1 Tax=Corynebacterium sp. MSK006 TaxID=3050187 RepID=UPI00254D583A|nr:MFS transporter [Corynebacterium sp. MSK006]MDK8895518.1 MFS transporter [Corynebacterium sp. MSK006]
MGSRHRVGRVTAALAFVAIFLAALNLRAGIASVGPVLADVLAWYSAGGALAGLVTAMPCFFFGVMGLAAVPLARRVGLSRALLGGMVLTTVGLGVRPWVGSVWAFLVLTACVVAGIALSNVLIPAWVKTHGGRNMVTLMTVNSSVLGLSGALGPLSAGLAHEPGGWRHALFIWVWLSVAQVLAWVIVAWRTGYDFPRSGARGAGPAVPLRRSPTAVALTAYFGLQSLQAYTQMGWLPQILIDSGQSRGIGSLALSITLVLGILGGLVMPAALARAESPQVYPVLFAALTALGWVGVLLAPSWSVLWAFVLGVGGWSFPTALNLIVVRARDPEVAARLSGFVQPVGYFLAMLAPLAVGFVYRPEMDWTVVILVLAGLAVAKGVVGRRAARPVLVDDELAVTRPC